MSDRLIVACVETENYCGRGREYVRKLAAGVRRNLAAPYEFVCVTDAIPDSPEEGIVYRAADPKLKGWWQKVSLFRPGVLPPGRVLFLDLDTVIVGDLTPLASPRPFSMLTDFLRGTPSSAIMAWPDGFGADIWRRYEEAGRPQVGGDQDWIAANSTAPDRLQDSVDGLLASWVHCRDGVPEGARAVSFWGIQRPHQANGWVQEAWVE